MSSSPYTPSVGAPNTGAGGGSGSRGYAAGVAGGSGVIIVEEYA